MKARDRKEFHALDGRVKTLFAKISSGYHTLDGIIVVRLEYIRDFYLLNVSKIPEIGKNSETFKVKRNW